MRSLKDIFEEYCFEICESATTFSLKDGTYYEGFMFQILETSLTFFLRGPLAPEEHIEIKFVDIDLNSLCYYVDAERKWKSAIWDDEKGIWIVSYWIRLKS